MSSETIYIEIDDAGQITASTLKEFIDANSDQGVVMIDAAELKALQSLKVGESTRVTGFVGTVVTIKRLPPPLPALASLYADDSLALLKDASAFHVLVNQPPKKEWCKVHPFLKDKDEEGREIPFLYIPIERIEWLLINVIVRYRIEILDVKQIANSIVIHVRLHYFDPVSGEWTYHDGVGAAPMQTDKGVGAIEWDKIKSNAVQIGAPAAKTYAVKDAAEQIGKLFGKDLNRRGVINYDFQKMVTDKYEKALTND